MVAMEMSTLVPGPVDHNLQSTLERKRSMVQFVVYNVFIKILFDLAHRKFRDKVSHNHIRNCLDTGHSSAKIYLNHYR